MRERGFQMMVFGAPYEADAQLNQLEKQGLIDVIVTEDMDNVLLGARLVQFGYNTRGDRNKKYFRHKFAPFKYKIDGVVSTVHLNTWLKCPRSKAAAAAFSGTDYNLGLRGVRLDNGRVERLVKAFMKRATPAEQDKYLATVGRCSQYAVRGSKVLTLTMTTVLTLVLNLARTLTLTLTLTLTSGRSLPYICPVP